MVWQVLEMLKAGYGFEDILREFPSLTTAHIKAALDFAAKKVTGERLVSA